jgi:uncharacterized protein
MRHADRRRFIGMGLATLGSAIAAKAVAAESGCSAPTAQAANAAANPTGVPATSATAPSATGAPAVATPTYLVIYRRGPQWADGKAMSEQQGMREHFAYYVDLHRKGLLKSGGGFTDDSGGAAVLEAADDAAAAAILAADPAVKGGVFAYELKRWRQNPWADISKARAARGL